MTIQLQGHIFFGSSKLYPIQTSAPPWVLHLDTYFICQKQLAGQVRAVKVEKRQISRKNQHFSESLTFGR